MKKILITGANSYIGTSFEKYMSQWGNIYQVDTIDMTNDTWQSKDFSTYDCIYHVAGIVHVKETPKNASMYYIVNRDLAIETAKKAKIEGVKQFIFLSSMSVYGMNEGAIDLNTPVCPKSNYAKSKFEAEQGLWELQAEDFSVAIMRPPMVYGNGCKGNYQALVKIAKISPFFPNYTNKRSMLSVDCLSWYVKDIIDNGKNGLFFPQDEQYVCTCTMVKDIAHTMGRRIIPLKCLNPLVWIAKKYTVAGKKAFGDLYYIKDDTD